MASGLVAPEPLSGLDQELDPRLRRVGTDFSSVPHREAKKETNIIDAKQILNICYHVLLIYYI